MLDKYWTDIVTTNHLHYKILLRVQPTLNSVVTIYLTTGILHQYGCISR